jgi:hypothetical protein
LLATGAKLAMPLTASRFASIPKSFTSAPTTACTRY